MAHKTFLLLPSLLLFRKFIFVSGTKFIQEFTRQKRPSQLTRDAKPNLDKSTLKAWRSNEQQVNSEHWASPSWLQHPQAQLSYIFTYTPTNGLFLHPSLCKPARPALKSQLPLYETNAALAHFDRMQFSLFYSFPFLFSHLSCAPNLLMARWSYKIISKYKRVCWRMNFAYLVFVVCAQLAVCLILFFSARENSLSGCTGKSSPR